MRHPESNGGWVFDFERWCGDDEIMISRSAARPWCHWCPLTLEPREAVTNWSWYLDTHPWSRLTGDFIQWGFTWWWAWMLSWWAWPLAALMLSYDADGSLNHTWSQWRLINAWADFLSIDQSWISKNAVRLLSLSLLAMNLMSLMPSDQDLWGEVRWPLPRRKMTSLRWPGACWQRLSDLMPARFPDSQCWRWPSIMIPETIA